MDKKSVEQFPGPLTKRRPTLSHPPSGKPKEYPVPETFAEMGDEVLMLSPTLQKKVRWKTPELGSGEKYTLEDWVKAIRLGLITGAMLRKELDMEQDPDKKRMIKGLIDQVQHEESMLKKASDYLIKVGSDIEKSGHTFEGLKIQGLSYMLKYAAHPEKHVIHSLETLYQNSDDFDDFLKNINSAQQALDKASDVLKEFESTYKEKAKAYAKGSITESEVEKISKVVRKMDARINRIIMDFESGVKK